MKLNVFLLAAFLAAPVSSLFGEPDGMNISEDIQEYVLNVDGDTIWAQFGEYLSAVPLSTVNAFDTTPLLFGNDFVLYSLIDTVIVKPSEHPATILITAPADTIIETVIFYRDLDELDKSRSETRLKEMTELLRQYRDYGHTDPGEYKSFDYSGPEDTSLIRLREEYKLDSVAGDGGEVERIINLMRWAHSIVRHDGNSENPYPANALHLIEVCKNENRGVNCRMMATILNEAYLSLGFKSRHVTCMPADTNDNDCHVINMVYSDSLGKWLYMDPTFEAYYMDKDGRLLSVAEVREMMISGDSLILSDGVNWNGSPKGTYDYNSYMAKNLFHFSCPIKSEFNYESSTENDLFRIFLEPPGYNSEKIGKTRTLGTGKVKLIEYYSDNSEYFWQKPN